jgi:transcriptional regulator with PAS, ATPase and Fis domain
VLEDGAISSIGANRPPHVSVRMLATINRPAEQRMQEDKLRADLYDRLRASTLAIGRTRCGSRRSVLVSDPERQDRSPR